MVEVFQNPVLLDKVVRNIPINVPVYGYNSAYTFNPGPNKVNRSMLYGIDGSIAPMQSSTWTMREQAPLSGTNGWGFAFDGSSDGIVHDFKTSDPTLPSGLYSVTFPYEMLASYKTQKSINATVITTGTSMSTDNSGTPISTDAYSGISSVVLLSIPQDKTGYSTIACYPDDPNVEWDGSYANGLTGLSGQDTTGGGPDGTLPYAVSKLSTMGLSLMLSQYVYMGGRKDRVEIAPNTKYTLSFYAKGTGKLDVYFINNFIDPTGSNIKITPTTGVSFVHPTNSTNSYAEISLTSTYTLYTITFMTMSTFNVNEFKQLMLQVLINSQAWVTPISLVKDGTTTNIIRASTYAPSAYTNASFEYKGWQIKARTDWNGIPIQGVSTMISNPVNIKSPGSTTKTFVNGLENFDLYNIVASNNFMFIKPDTGNAQMSYATNATSNISMVYGLPASDESNGTSSLFTQHGATDSRGYSSTTTIGNQTTVYPYTKPTLSGLTITRTANMAELIPTFTINGTQSINSKTTDTTIVANLTINGTAYVIIGVTSNASLKSKSWYTRNSNGALVSATPVNVDPFTSYTVTFEVHDSVYAGGPKSTVATSTQVNTAGGTPVAYTPSWSAVPVGTTSASLKSTTSVSSNIVYNQPSLTPQGSNYGTYYTGEFDTPPVTYHTDDPRYHKNLRFDFTLAGTVIVGPGSTINNLTRVDFTCDGVTYSNILGGNGQNAVGPYSFTTNKLNNGNGLGLDPGIVHTGSLILYDTKNGLTAGSSPVSTINWSSTPDSILLDIDGDINNGGGIGIGGYHKNANNSLEVYGPTYIGKQPKDNTSNSNFIGLEIDGDIELYNNKKLLDTVWPIGSIYISVTDANPATTLGFGTWSAFAKGRTLIGVDPSDTALNAPNKQGGSVNPLTSHNHYYKSLNGYQSYTFAWGTGGIVSPQISINGTSAIAGKATNNGLFTKQDGDGASVQNSGDNTNHNNWQPFISTYMWKRDA